MPAFNLYRVSGGLPKWEATIIESSEAHARRWYAHKRPDIPTDELAVRDERRDDLKDLCP